MSEYDPSARTPDMSIHVSLGSFHSTHDAAHEAQKLAKQGVDKLSIAELRNALIELEAGQRLTDAETGSDFMYATSYRAEIRAVEQEIAQRLPLPFETAEALIDYTELHAKSERALMLWQHLALAYFLAGWDVKEVCSSEMFYDQRGFTYLHDYDIARLCSDARRRIESGEILKDWPLQCCKLFR